jgi:hypothetical protein
MAPRLIIRSIALSASDAATDSAPVSPSAQSFSSTSTDATETEASAAERFSRVWMRDGHRGSVQRFLRQSSPVGRGASATVSQVSLWFRCPAQAPQRVALHPAALALDRQAAPVGLALQDAPTTPISACRLTGAFMSGRVRNSAMSCVTSAVRTPDSSE